MPSLRGPDILDSTDWNTDHNQKKPLLTRIRSFVAGVKNACVDWITQYRIFRIPLLNWFIIVFYAVFLIRLTFRFRALYAKRALITMMVTNLLLYGLADTLAQTLRTMVAFKPEPLEQPKNLLFVRYILEKGRPRRVILEEEEDEELLELGLDEELLSDNAPHPHRPQQPEIFHFRRLALFTVWGFLLSFVQSPWYSFLNSINENNKFISVLRRVLADQLCYSPISLCCFFIYATVVIEGGDKAAVVAKLKKSYLPTLAINYCVWPAAQFINFLVIPRAVQIPFSSTIGVFWNAYLSLKNASA
ncbi:hypothetical protein TRVA0_037S00738 [Trichomonascus vanleenenianus]|uniref:uncharacterized protein n=1 Tax=Trichomonascus vanleenenianus TaxID=2268995 RepID=UPI003ECAA8D2